LPRLLQGCSKARRGIVDEWVGPLKNRYVRKWESLPRSFYPPFCSSRSAYSSYLPFGSFMSSWRPRRCI